MDKCLISVIVPIFNVEKQLDRCIYSIINQTYKNIEIILVDDGSTDSCGIICDNYNKIDKRIIVLHKANGGLSSARNAGLDNAKGDLIAFVDSDDYLEINYLEELYNNMNKYNSDISVCNVYYWKNKKKSTVIKEVDNEFVSSNKEKFENINNKYSSLTVYAWNKLYKRKIFENIRYPDGKIYEDSYILCEILDKTNIISYTLKPLYNYVYRKDSIVNKFGINHFDKIASSNRKIDYLNKMEYYDLALKEKNRKALEIINNLSKMICYRIKNKKVWNKYYKELLDTTKEIKWKDSSKNVKRFKIIKKFYIYLRSVEYKAWYVIKTKI